MDDARDLTATTEINGEQAGNPHRRDLLKCMVWAGIGVLRTMSGGVPRSSLLGSAKRLLGCAVAAARADTAFSFVQISNSHIGFTNLPNTDTPGTLGEATALVGRQKGDATLMLHIGDVSQLSKPAQFDTADQIIREAKLDVRYVPGEHDVLVNDGRAFFERFTPDTAKGWYSWDQQGVHFVALNNVQDLKAAAWATSAPNSSSSWTRTSRAVLPAMMDVASTDEHTFKPGSMAGSTSPRRRSSGPRGSR